MPAKGQGCTRVQFFTGGISRFGHRSRHCRRMAGAAVRAKPATHVTLLERTDAAMTHSTSYWAGGMLAPCCEREVVRTRHQPARHTLARTVARRMFRKRRSTARWWSRTRATASTSNVLQSSPPATGALTRDALGELEPSLDGRFRDGLFFPDEGHVEPRAVLPQLHAPDRQGRRAGSNSTARSARKTSTASSSIAAGLQPAIPSANCAASRARWSSSRPMRSSCRARCG